MSLRIRVPLAVAALIVCACATPNDTTGDKYSPVVMRTGSNIPTGRERNQVPREKTLADEALMEELRKLRTPGRTGD